MQAGRDVYKRQGWDSSDYYSFKAFGGDLDYYFMYGPDFYTMIDRYTEVTGRSPMLPRFAMGLHVGTYSGGTWKNEEMTSDKYPPALCKRLREEGVPFDLLWLEDVYKRQISILSVTLMIITSKASFILLTGMKNWCE